MCSAPVADRKVGAGRERPEEEHVAGGLADVDEAAGAGEAVAEATDVDVAGAVDLRHAEERLVEPRPVVEVELVGLVDDGLRVGGGAEAQPTGRQAADRPGLDRERDEVEDALLAGHRRDLLWDADAQIHDGVDLQQHRGPTRDDLAGVERGRDGRGRVDADCARVRGVEGLRERLHVRVGGGDDDAVDEDARHADLARREHVASRDLLDLNDDDAARVLGRLRDGQGIQRGRLALHGHVAVLVGGRAAQERHIDWAARVEEVFLRRRARRRERPRPSSPHSSGRPRAADPRTCPGRPG